MRKIVLIAALTFGTHLVSAQAAEKMSYQAIVRNATGQLLTNQNVALRVSILQGSAAGTTVYSERVSGTTNVNGLVSLEIGSGTVLSGTFSSINWGANSHYLKTETDPTGGTNYTITGTSQILSVPYALYAKSSGGGSGSLVLPFTATANNPNSLFSLTNSGTGTSLHGITSGTGRAGRFENTNAANDKNTFEVESNSNGNIPNNMLGNVSSFLSNNTNSVSAAVRGEVKTIFGNFGAAGIFGVSSGTGGFGGLFHASNPTGNGSALVAITDGNGDAFKANAGKDGDAIEANVDGSGRAIYAWIPSYSTGKVAEFKNFNTANTTTALSSTTLGNGIAGDFFVDNTSGTSPAVHGRVNSIFSNFGTAAIYGESLGTGGYGGLFYSRNTAGNGPAVLALTEGSGNGVTANAGGSGDGVEATIDGAGTAIFGWVPNFSTGKAARFVNFNTANTNPVLTVENRANSDLLLLKATASSVNVARINAAGKGFFNGGTQNSGADLAEAFDVEGNPADYEPGDILVISTDNDRTIEKSAIPYSSLVAGVYATKPGVLLTEENIDSELIDKVPMGVIGVIPTKVCLEGGNIKRGDLIVTSSISGVAMKADSKKVQIGQVLGKALQDYNDNSIGKIKVLVSIK